MAGPVPGPIPDPDTRCARERAAPIPLPHPVGKPVARPAPAPRPRPRRLLVLRRRPGRGLAERVGGLPVGAALDPIPGGRLRVHRRAEGVRLIPIPVPGPDPDLKAARARLREVVAVHDDREIRVDAVAGRRNRDAGTCGGRRDALLGHRGGCSGALDPDGHMGVLGVVLRRCGARAVGSGGVCGGRCVVRLRHRPVGSR